MIDIGPSYILSSDRIAMVLYLKVKKQFGVKFDKQKIINKLSQ